MKRMIPITLAAAAASVNPAAAQSVGDDFRNVGRDAWFIVSSPAHASRHDLGTAALAAAATAGLVLVADQPIQDWVRTEPWPVKLLAPFRDTSPLSLVGRTWFFLLPLSLSLYAAGHAFDSGDLRAAGFGCMTSNLTTTLSRTSVSLLLGRQRPGERRGPLQFELFAFGPWPQRSFPGGHASNVMSCASYFNHRFDLGIAGPAVWATAAAVGLARIPDEAHWTSDTFAGMAYGYAVGSNVARRYLDRATPARAEQSLQPGLSVGVRWTF